MAQPKIGGSGEGTAVMVYGSDGVKHTEIYVGPAGFQTVKDASGDKIISLESAFGQRRVESAVSAGNRQMTTTPVPKGKMHVITAATAFNSVSNITRIELARTDGTNVYLVDVYAPSANYDPAKYSGWLFLPEDWYFRADYIGCQNGDDIFLDIQGIQMNAP